MFRRRSIIALAIALLGVHAELRAADDGTVMAFEKPDGSLCIRLPAVNPTCQGPDDMIFTTEGSSASEVVATIGDGSPEVSGRYPWKLGISTTVFWVGELPTRNNPVPNTMSSWDKRWVFTFGGLDHPLKRQGLLPRDFTPKCNPFYVALPYNDLSNHGTKPEARLVIPWFSRTFVRDGESVCKGRWVAIRRGARVCYAQWEDCGPFRTDHWQYVFGNERPRPNLNRGAGIDVSPAVRDFLGLNGMDTTDWKFVEATDVPGGPWKSWGRADVMDNFVSNDVPR